MLLGCYALQAAESDRWLTPWLSTSFNLPDFNLSDSDLSDPNSPDRVPISSSLGSPPIILGVPIEGWNAGKN